MTAADTVPTLPVQRGVPILSAIVGSQAYGLATPESDIDRLGVYAAPTVAFHGLRPPDKHTSTWKSDQSDITMHEAAKFCRMALTSNPTNYELLWLPERCYEVRTGWAEQLIAIRDAFPSRRAVRDSYFGYATQQLRKLVAHGGFGNGMDKRGEKNARHLLRLLMQGAELYRTGAITVELADPEHVREFGRRAMADTSVATAEMARYEHLFDTTVSPLPEQPRTEVVEDWLHGLRADDPGSTR